MSKARTAAQVANAVYHGLFESGASAGRCVCGRRMPGPHNRGCAKS